MSIEALALWGLAGAFVYAAPRFLMSLSETRLPEHRWYPFAEFLVSLGIGPIAGAGFGQFVAGSIHMLKSEELRAITVVVGMIANPVAPAIVQLLGTGLVRRLGGATMPLKRTPGK